MNERREVSITEKGGRIRLDDDSTYSEEMKEVVIYAVSSENANSNESDGPEPSDAKWSVRILF